jgi:simple sugar transport system ATP-binding protein
MRLGKMVGSREPGETSREELAEMMVGRSVQLEADRSPAEVGDVVLRAEGLTWRDVSGAARLTDVSFDLRAGEILGVAGVSGNGQSELLDLLSGIAPVQDGNIEFAGRRVDRRAPLTPSEMRDLALAHVPEDRHRMGLVLPFEARENAVLGYHNGEACGQGAFTSLAAMQKLTTGMMDAFDVRPPNPRLAARGFSGGNQQKIVLAREIGAAPKVLLVGQPTRGVDIGAIEFIHAQLIALKQAGCAVLLVSVELDEILSLSDRIMVLNAGRVVGTLKAEEADRQRLGLMMGGVSGAAALGSSTPAPAGSEMSQ